MNYVPYARYERLVEERSQLIDRIEALEAALREIYWNPDNVIEVERIAGRALTPAS